MRVRHRLGHPPKSLHCWAHRVAKEKGPSGPVRPSFSFAHGEPIGAMQRTGSVNFCLDGASLERISAAGLLSKLNSSVQWER